MFGVFADNHNLAFSLYDLALLADLLYGWFNLHSIIPTLSFLLCTPGNASLRKVIYRHLDGYAVTGQNSDIVHSQLSRDMSRYYMPIGKLDLEGGVRQCLNDGTLKFDNIILRQNNPSSASILRLSQLPRFVDQRCDYKAV